MDRQIIYSGQIPLDTDQLKQNRNVMVSLGYALQAIMGSSTLVDGLACTPTSPASLSVNVAAGSIYSLQNVDGTAYGSLAPDTTHSIIKQGIIEDAANFSCPAPATTGESINYLIQAAYQDSDTGSTVLPYYNASNPSQAYNGPNNTGTSQNTVRQGICLLGIKAGVAATTGSQTTPSPDAGYVGLFSITVANGQSTVTSGNINQFSTAPFVGVKLGSILQAIQSGATNYAVDSSGAANTVTAAFSPTIALPTAGLAVRVQVANSNTGASTLNGNAIHNPDGSALHIGQLKAGNIYTFVFDGNYWQLQSLPGDFQSLLVNSALAPTSNVTLTSTYNRNFVGAVATAGAFTIELPLTSGNQGFTVFIVKADASANVVTIDGNGSTISGLSQLLLRNQGESVLLYCDGSNWEAISHLGKRRMVQAFTASGTFSVPNDVKVLEKVTVIGGGGGGGGCAVNTAGGGGGSGATAIAFNVSVTPGASITVTIGSGGAGGTGSPTNGTAGGTTTFGSSSPVTANGGGGGFSAGTGGAGGTASGGTVDISGGGGGAGAPTAGNGSGVGGSSSFGGGGNAVNNGNAGNAGAAYGSGGSGGAGSGSSGYSGGAGQAGFVLVEYNVGQ